MTKTFILVTLADRQTLTFGHPILTWVKENFPKVQILDVDAHSDDYLVSQACALVKESTLAVICFNVKTPHSSLGASIKLLEAILQTSEKGYVFLNGDHNQLNNILADRVQVSFQKVETPNALEEEIKKVFSVMY